MVTLSPAADTCALEYLPTEIFGANEALWVRKDTNYFARTFIRFDLSDLPTAIPSAKLYLYYSFHSAGNDPVGSMISLHRVLASWEEMALTWSAQPAFDSSVAAYAVVPGSYGWMVWDVTGEVSYLVSHPAENFGWCIKFYTEGGTDRFDFVLMSKEYLELEKPYMEVELGATKTVTITSVPVGASVSVD